MLKYILKRLGLCLLILLAVSLIIYVLVRCMPTDFVEDKINSMQQNNPNVGEDVIENMKKVYGVEDDSALGVLKGYIKWISDVMRLDLGKTFKSNTPVVTEIRDAMPTSFIVALIATFFEFMIAIPLGITAATHQYSIRDYVVTVLVMVGISLPSFFLGKMLLSVFAQNLGWFEFGTFDWEMSPLKIASHLFLPILTVVILSIGGRMRMTRTNMLEVLNSDFIRTARAKGLSERKVIYKHAFRNTLIPLVTSLAGLLPTLFSGAIITEQVFDIPGIGNVALEAMMAGDIPFIMGYNVFLALLSVLGVLLSDLMYVIVDPRVKMN